MIERAPVSTYKMSYDDAVMYCFLLKHDGKRGWRLPTIREFITDSWYEDEPISKRQWYCAPVRDCKD